MRVGVLALAAVFLFQECVRWGQRIHEDMMEKFNKEEGS